MDLKYSIFIRQLGQQSYHPVWQAMKNYTDKRDKNAPDEIWLVEHDAVFTQGQAGKSEHLLAPGEIPVVQVDRGGQVTYHGPGQQVAYLMIDIRRKGFGVRSLVTGVENAIVKLAADYGIEAAPRADAPGVYVDGAKLCSLGLRIRRGCSFHGLALNVAMDLEPFQRINPCGLAGISMTQLADLGGPDSLQKTAEPLITHLLESLDYKKQYSQSERETMPMNSYPYKDND